MDIIELILYLVVFVGVVIYSNVFVKKKKTRENNGINNNTARKYNQQEGWTKMDNRRGTTYNTSRNKRSNPILNSANNISYKRPLVLFFIFAFIAIIIVGLYTGQWDSFVSDITQKLSKR